MNGLLTVSETADRLNVSTATVYAAVASGELGCYRIRTGKTKRGTIRFSEEQIDAYLEGVRQGGVKVVVKPLRNLHLEN